MPIPRDRLVFLFSRFSDSREMAVLFEQALYTKEALDEYSEGGRRHDLARGLLHLETVLEVVGRYLGKNRFVQDRWDEQIMEQYNQSIATASRNQIMETLSSSAREVPHGIYGNAEAVWQKIIDVYFDENFSPGRIERKLGAIGSALISAAKESKEELWKEQSGWPWGLSEATGAFLIREPSTILRQQWSFYSGLQYTDSSLELNRFSRDVDWTDEDLASILAQIDFNAKALGLAVVRASGIAVCVAGAAGAVASLVSINPVLTAASISVMVVGASLAVDPNSAKALAKKLLG